MKMLRCVALRWLWWCEKLDFGSSRRYRDREIVLVTCLTLCRFVVCSVCRLRLKAVSLDLLDVHGEDLVTIWSALRPTCLEMRIPHTSERFWYLSELIKGCLTFSLTVGSSLAMGHYSCTNRSRVLLQWSMIP